jgi:hypothetical protein
MDWNSALAIWRASGGTGGIPKKGTPEYDKVKEIQASGVAPPPKVATMKDSKKKPKEKPENHLMALLKEADAKAVAAVEAAPPPAPPPQPALTMKGNKKMKKPKPEEIEKAAEEVADLFSLMSMSAAKHRLPVQEAAPPPPPLPKAKVVVAEHKAAGGGGGRPMNMLEQLMSGKATLSKDFKLPEPVPTKTRQELKAEAEAAEYLEHEYEMGWKERPGKPALWEDTQARLAAEYPVVLDFVDGKPPHINNPLKQPEGELAEAWRFKWKFVEYLKFLIPLDRGVEKLIILKPWITACLDAHRVLPMVFAGFSVKEALFTQLLWYGADGNIYEDILQGHLTLPEGYPDAEEVDILYTQYCQHQVDDTYGWRSGKSEPKKYREAFDKLIYCKTGVEADPEMMYGVFQTAAIHNKYSDNQRWVAEDERQNPVRTAAREAAAEARRKAQAAAQEEKRKAERVIQREDAIAALTAYGAAKQGEKGCRKCREMFGSLSRPHLGLECPMLKALNCYYCHQSGHSPKDCPRNFKIVRAGNVPTDLEHEILVQSNADLDYLIGLAGLALPETGKEKRKLIHSIANTMTPLFGVSFMNYKWED